MKDPIFYFWKYAAGGGLCCNFMNAITYARAISWASAHIKDN